MTHTTPSPHIELATYNSPLGTMTLAASAQGLCGVWFDGQAHQPDPQQWEMNTAHPVLQAACSQLAAYFAAQAARFALPLDVSLGTPFQQSVWKRLQAIPYGVTQSYGEIARYLGQPAASRAVGAAVGRNPLSIIVPCHRVVGSDGALTGYAGGLERKIALLQLEKAL
jgi:methylated-DNA-[protein]-cysteine S-methyltransferase